MGADTALLVQLRMRRVGSKARNQVCLLESPPQKEKTELVSLPGIWALRAATVY